MIKKHWNISYACARAKAWRFERSNPDAPWFTQDAVRLLSQLIRREDRVLEFGSGRSTMWFASRCSEIVSVEHDEVWHSKVKQMLDGRSNVRCLLEPTTSCGESTPEYVRVLEKFEDGSIDVIVNDGKLRHLVGLLGVDKLRKGGLMVIDNAERYVINEFSLPESRGSRTQEPLWQQFADITGSWRRIWTCNGLTATLIMFRP